MESHDTHTGDIYIVGLIRLKIVLAQRDSVEVDRYHNDRWVSNDTYPLSQWERILAEVKVRGGRLIRSRAVKEAIERQQAAQQTANEVRSIKRPWSQEELDLVRQQVLAGVTFVQIAKTLGRGSAPVVRKAQAMGLSSIRGSTRVANLEPKILAMLRIGKRRRDVAKAIGVSYSSVDKVAVKHGIPVKRIAPRVKPMAIAA